LRRLTAGDLQRLPAPKRLTTGHQIALNTIG